MALRTPGDGPQGRITIKRTYKTFYAVLREAARWLAGQDVTHVAMEATGIYSTPVCHAMIEHGGFEQVLVCNPGHVKNVPGHKTDYADAEWLAQLLECGLLNASFIPSAAVKAARDVLRYRTKVVQQRTSGSGRWPPPRSSAKSVSARRSSSPGRPNARTTSPPAKTTRRKPSG